MNDSHLDKLEPSARAAIIYMRDIDAMTPPEEFEAICDAFGEGWNHAHGIACHNVPQIGDQIDSCVDWVGLGDKVDESNVRDVHEIYCHESEMHARCFSPWEYIAHDINSHDEWLSESMWESYDAGVAASIAHDISTYTDDDYGILEDQS